MWLLEETKAEWPVCDQCKTKLKYLLQLYAPVDELVHAYHRVLYVFYCPNAKCAHSGKEVKVFRVQADDKATLFHPPKVTEVPAEAKEEGKQEVPEQKTEEPAKKTAEEEKAAKEGKEEKKGDKKKRKKRSKKGKAATMGTKAVHEISVSTEKADATKYYETRIKALIAKKDGEKDSDEEELKEDPVNLVICTASDEKHEKELLKQYLEIESTRTPADKLIADAEIKELEDMALEREAEMEDRYFDLFQWVSMQTPNQVLRYARHFPGIEPLWYKKEGRLMAKPKCGHCGGETVFEMQIMPQLFNYVPELAQTDWATIIVYT